MSGELSESELLELAGEERVEDVRTLVLRELGVVEVGPLFARFSALEVLSLSNNAVQSLSGCAALVHLSVLNINFNRVTSLDPLSHCVALRQLFASHNKISSLSPLSACTQLTALSLFHNQIASLDTALGVLTALPALSELDLASNPCALGPPYRHRLVRELNLHTLDGDTLTPLDAELAEDFWRQPSELSARAYAPSGAPSADAAIEQQLQQLRPTTPGRASVGFRDPFLNANPILIEYMCEAELGKHGAAADTADAPAAADCATDGTVLSLRRPMVERLRLTAAAMDSASSSSPTQLASSRMFQPVDAGVTAEQRTTKQLLQLVHDLAAERDEARERVRQLEAAANGATPSDEIEELRNRNAALAVENANMFVLKEEISALKAQLAEAQEKLQGNAQEELQGNAQEELQGNAQRKAQERAQERAQAKAPARTSRPGSPLPSSPLRKRQP